MSKPNIRTKDMSIRHANGDCVSTFEGLTFGVLDGKAFDTFNASVDAKSKIEWARAGWRSR